MNLWTDYVQAEGHLVQARMRLFSGEVRVAPLVRSALRSVAERRAALRLLRDQDVPMLVEVFEDLVEIADSAHVDVASVRSLIARVPEPYLDEHLWRLIEPRLQKHDDDEPFRRYAELLTCLNRRDDLGLLLAIAANSPNDDVREVASDFESPDWEWWRRTLFA